MKCQIPSAVKNKKNIISLPSAEFAQSMVSVNKKYILYFQTPKQLLSRTLPVYAR